MKRLATFALLSMAVFGCEHRGEDEATKTPNQVETTSAPTSNSSGGTNVGGSMCGSYQGGAYQSQAQQQPTTVPSQSRRPAQIPSQAQGGTQGAQ
ncbi:MAG: hypothetical protein ABIP39_04700, partial [Polyangiaceae bacterium]